MTTMQDDPLRLDEARDAQPIKCAGCERTIVKRPDTVHRPAPLESFGEHFCNERCKQERNAERFELMAGLLESDAREIDDTTRWLERFRGKDAIVETSARHVRRILFSTMREYGIKTPGGSA